MNYDSRIEMDAEQGKAFSNLVLEILDAAEALRTAIAHYPVVSPEQGEMCARLTTEAFADVIERRASRMREMLEAHRRSREVAKS